MQLVVLAALVLFSQKTESYSMFKTCNSIVAVQENPLIFRMTAESLFLVHKQELPCQPIGARVPGQRLDPCQSASSHQKYVHVWGMCGPVVRAIG